MRLDLFLPEITLAVTAILVVLVDLFVKRKGTLSVLSLLGLLAAAALAATLRTGGGQALFGGSVVLDNYALFFKLLFPGIAILVILSSADFMKKLSALHGEYHALILLATLGMMLMASTGELITIYVSLELASLSLYALTGFMKDEKSTESAIKYMLLGAVSSAILLYGMALVFGFTGSTRLGEIAAAISTADAATSPGLLAGVVMMLAGFGFKIAAVPFQLWTPDVYEGAPTPIVGLLSVGSKAAGFAVILRVFSTAFGQPAWLSNEWGYVFAFMAVLGMFTGNVSAIRQANIKRLFGYSSIAQAGYILVGVAALGLGASSGPAISSVVFFLFSYALANLGAFAAIIAISNKIESDQISDYAGMSRRAPGLALALTVSLVSLIGMPPAAGFVGKFYIFNGAAQAGLLWLVIIAVLNSVISAFYYLRIVKVMWFGQPASAERVPSSGALRLALGVSTLGVLLVGVFPGYVLKLAQWAARLFS